MAETTNRADRNEIARHIERAEKLLQKGKTSDALDEYLHVLLEDPGNDMVRQMAADLCLSLQRTPDAIRLLGELFDHQVDAGDATRASITYKKLARYVTPTWDQKVHFGQILENSNRKLALETYESALEELNKQGRKPDALLVLKRVVALDASERNYLRLGELSSEVGDNKGAAASFLKLAELTEAAGGNAATFFERAYTEDSTDPQIALCYSKSLLQQEQVGAAIFVLEPHISAGMAPLDMRDTYAKALLKANRLTEAEPLVWQLFEQNPVRIHEVATLIGQMIDSEQDAEAVAVARKLEAVQRRRGERRAFLQLMQEISGAHRASSDVLEFMSELFNANNREADYCQTLLKLFDLHYVAGNFDKAAECLDRAIEVDAYEPGNGKRMESLKGKIDDSRFKVIASRMANMNQSVPQPIREESTLGAAALQDLMLQAEILVQYGMRSKAIERLQRIQELFPREEERNQDLQQLYLAAGMTPRYASSAPTAAAPAPQPPPPPAAPVAPAPQAAAQHPELADVSSFTRIAEITRKLYRQGKPDAVLATAANEIGNQWKTSRCIAAMRRPGLPPTGVKESCTDGIPAGDAGMLARLVTALQDAAVSRGSLLISDAGAAPELQPVRDAVAGLNITSLLALPIVDGSDPVGVLILAQNSPRGWNANDVLVLKTVCDQIVIALNNAGLRQLVKNLSVTDERSGLLKRASYIDLLMAETRRAVQQATSVTVLLMQFGKSAALVKEHGEAAVEQMMQKIGQIFASNIRQNDLAFRYAGTTIAIILGETGEKEAQLAVEKLRKLLAEVKLPDKDESVRFSAGLAEAVVRQQYDPVDIVTEVINRAELALDMSVAQGAGKVVALTAKLSNSAVA